MKSAKRLIVILLPAALMLTLTACKKNKENDTPPQETAAPTVTESPAPTETPEPFVPEEGIMMPEGTLIG